MSGSRCAATANASRICMPLEYRLTGVSRNVPTSANSTISSKRCVDLGAAQAVDRAIQVDVLAAGQIALEAGADLQQRRRAARAAGPRPGSGR